MTFSFARRKRRALKPPSRIYAIGDIHGRLDLFGELCRLLEADVAAHPTETVHLVLLGDLIDRGPESRPLLELLMRVTQRKRITVLKGNHEAALVDAWRGNHDALELWLEHGGDATLASFGVDIAALDTDDSLALMRVTREAIPAATIAWLDNLPTWIEMNGYYFVHAGVRPGVPLRAQSDRDRLWIREPFTSSGRDHGAMVVHGHTVEGDRVRIMPNRIGIDTGAYRTGCLSAIVIEDGELRVIATGPAGLIQ